MTYYTDDIIHYNEEEFCLSISCVNYIGRLAICDLSVSSADSMGTYIRSFRKQFDTSLEATTNLLIGRSWLYTCKCCKAAGYNYNYGDYYIILSV